MSPNWVLRVVSHAPLLEATDIHVRRGRRWTVEGITVEGEKGDVIGVIGLNGSGKTTLLQVLSTLRKPDRGLLRISGVDAAEDLAAARASIGYLPDRAPHYPELTPLEFVSLFARARRMGRREAQDRAETVLATAGLSRDAWGRRMRDLSRGMRQRASLACAIVHDPALLLLDEPETGLDIGGRAALATFMRTYAAQDKCVVLATHDMTLLRNSATRILVLNEGRGTYGTAPREDDSSAWGRTFFPLEKNSGGASAFEASAASVDAMRAYAAVRPL